MRQGGRLDWTFMLILNLFGFWRQWGERVGHRGIFRGSGQRFG